MKKEVSFETKCINVTLSFEGINIKDYEITIVDKDEIKEFFDGMDYLKAHLKDFGFD